MIAVYVSVIVLLYYLQTHLYSVESNSVVIAERCWWLKCTRWYRCLTAGRNFLWPLIDRLAKDANGMPVQFHAQNVRCETAPFQCQTKDGFDITVKASYFAHVTNPISLQDILTKESFDTKDGLQAFANQCVEDLLKASIALISVEKTPIDQWKKKLAKVKPQDIEAMTLKKAISPSSISIEEIQLVLDVDGSSEHYAKVWNVLGKRRSEAKKKDIKECIQAAVEELANAKDFSATNSKGGLFHINLVVNAQ